MSRLSPIVLALAFPALTLACNAELAPELAPTDDSVTEGDAAPLSVPVMEGCNAQQAQTINAAMDILLEMDVDALGACLSRGGLVENQCTFGSTIAHELLDSTATTNIECVDDPCRGVAWDDQVWIAGDFDGDGDDDLVRVYDNGGNAAARRYNRTATGFVRGSLTMLAGFSRSQKWMAGDFDGDGIDDLVNVYGNDGVARAWVHRSTGFSFEQRTSFTVLAGFWAEQKWMVGNFDGDPAGRDDLVNVYEGPDGNARAWVHLSTGAGFEYLSSRDTLAGFWDGQNWLAGDFDGDGADDLVNVYRGPEGNARAWVHESTGAGFEYQSSVTTLAGFWDRQRWLVGNADGDAAGRDDLINVYGNPEGQARAWVHRSTGAGFEGRTSFTELAGFWDNQRWIVGQMNGDGAADLINVYESVESTARAWVHLATADGFEYQSSFTPLLDGTTNACAPVGIADEEFDIGREFVDNNTPTRVASVIAHELMHNRGYRHIANPIGTPSYRLTVPEQVEACVLQNNASPNATPSSFTETPAASGCTARRAWVHGSTGGGFEYRSWLQSLAEYTNDDRVLVGDFDGDGTDDVATVFEDAEGTAQLWVSASTGSSFAFRTSLSEGAGFSSRQRWLAGDFDGDGVDDLVNVYEGPDGKARAWVHRSTGNGFERRSSFTAMAGFFETQHWMTGDFDGDGRDDLVSVYGSSAGQARAWVHRSTGAGFEYRTSFTVLGGFWESQKWRVGDFDGDGRDDLVNIYRGPTGTARVWLHRSTGGGFEYRTSLTSLANFWDGQRWLVGDFDGDGRDDLVNVYGNSEGRARAWVHASTGSSFAYRSSFTSLGGFWESQQWTVGNFDGDSAGRDDLLNLY